MTMSTMRLTRLCSSISLAIALLSHPALGHPIDPKDKWPLDQIFNQGLMIQAKVKPTAGILVSDDNAGSPMCGILAYNKHNLGSDWLIEKGRVFDFPTSASKRQNDRDRAIINTLSPPSKQADDNPGVWVPLGEDGILNLSFVSTNWNVTTFEELTWACRDYFDFKIVPNTWLKH